MESIALVLCVAAAATGQILHPMSTMGMGGAWGNPLWHTGMRYPGVAQTSQVSSMTYPTYRNHPLFRMAAVLSERNAGSSSGSDVLNVPKVPSSQEILTHMALANANPKPYLDTMTDFFYEPQKARTVVTPIVTAVAPVAPVAPVSPVSSVSSVASSASPVYTHAMNLMRANTFGDDCGPQDARWERGMDWLY